MTNPYGFTGPEQPPGPGQPPPEQPPSWDQDATGHSAPGQPPRYDISGHQFGYDTTGQQPGYSAPGQPAAAEYGPVQQQPVGYPPGPQTSAIYPPGPQTAAPYPVEPSRLGRPVALWTGSILVWLTCLAYVAAGVGIISYRGRLTQMITDATGLEEFWPTIHEIFPVIDQVLTTLAAPLIAIGVVIAIVGIIAFRGSNAARWAIVIIVGIGALPPLVGLLAGEIRSLVFLAFQILVITLYALPACSRWYAEQGGGSRK